LVGQLGGSKEIGEEWDRDVQTTKRKSEFERRDSNSGIGFAILLRDGV
jgi:hypothetical protein